MSGEINLTQLVQNAFKERETTGEKTGNKTENFKVFFSNQMFHIGCKILARHEIDGCVKNCNYAQFVMMQSVFLP